MTKYFYKENCNFSKKVEELFEKMDELGLTIEMTRFNGICIKDKDNHYASLRDNENINEFVLSIPSVFEYKLLVSEQDEIEE